MKRRWNPSPKATIKMKISKDSRAMVFRMFPNMMMKIPKKGSCVKCLIKFSHPDVIKIEPTGHIQHSFNPWKKQLIKKLHYLLCTYVLIITAKSKREVPDNIDLKNKQ